MGYAGNVINDDVVYDGPKELNQFTYRYDAGNGFTAVISLEDSSLVCRYVDPTAARGKQVRANQYAPDVVAGAGYKAGAWTLGSSAAMTALSRKGAIKARIDADFGDFEAFLMGGWNTDGDKLNKYAGSYSQQQPRSLPDQWRGLRLG